MQVMVEDVAVKMSAQLFEASQGPGQIPPAGKPAPHTPVHFHLFPFPCRLMKSASSEAVWISHGLHICCKPVGVHWACDNPQDFSSQEHTGLRIEGSILLLLVITAIAWGCLSAGDWQSSR